MLVVAVAHLRTRPAVQDRDVHGVVIDQAELEALVGRIDEHVAVLEIPMRQRRRLQRVHQIGPGRGQLVEAVRGVEVILHKAT